ncbi:MAG: FlgD immunoglobulin-like domain containing protein [Candidatus Krumholzibacteriales bacterium]
MGKSLNYSFENGIEASIYTPGVIEEEMTRRNEAGELIFVVERGWEYALIEDAEDREISFSGDGEFHPHRFMDIVEALSSVDVNGHAIDIEIKVYLLPFPRRGIINSTASGYRIFLSPGVLEPSSTASRYTVTHELGHCVQTRYLPADSVRQWQVYTDMRGLATDWEGGLNNCCHSDNPLEVFAEDFRYLFAGDGALYTDAIENSELPLPDEVPGLEDFFCSLIGGYSPARRGSSEPAALAASNYPNPFNPSTTVRVDLNRESVKAATYLSISVFDVRGRLVREIYNEPLPEGTVTATWDGRDRRGLPASSGVYLYVVKAGREISSGKMLLLR